jgi:hypothetical protein
VRSQLVLKHTLRERRERRGRERKGGKESEGGR